VDVSTDIISAKLFVAIRSPPQAPWQVWQEYISLSRKKCRDCRYEACAQKW